MKKVRVTFGDGVYNAVHDPTYRWNGWLVPYFTREVAEQIARDTQADHAEWPETEYFTFDSNGVCWWHYPADGDDYPAGADELPPTPDGLYAMGSGSWCWYEEGT